MVSMLAETNVSNVGEGRGKDKASTLSSFFFL
jgi:hypothetical protein